MRWIVFIILLSFFGGIIAAGLYFGKKDASLISTPESVEEKVEWNIEVIAQNLEVPWDMVLTPDENLLITERPGKVKLLTKSAGLSTIATLDQVYAVGESGLTGITIHPDFNQNHFVYLYYSFQKGNQILNRISRFTFSKDSLKDEEVILDNLPGGLIHNGGRLKFGPDKNLYILTGDAGNESLAQNLKSLGGKVLKLQDNGSILIFSYGHRNPQGITWIDNNLYISEHGSSAYDEINKIEPGKNYGWGIIKKCFSDDPQYTNPILCSEQTTWAPSGLATFKGSLIFAGLRGQILKRVKVMDGKLIDRETIIQGEYGRLRGVLTDDRGNIYVSTSNRDGRGVIQEGDDKILKISKKR